jgi:hypothetical protein
MYGDFDVNALVSIRDYGQSHLVAIDAVGERNLPPRASIGAGNDLVSGSSMPDSSRSVKILQASRCDVIGDKLGTNRRAPCRDANVGS